MTNPFEDPDLHESILLGGVRSPGKVRLSGHDRKVVWDIQDGNAQQGARMTIKKIPPVEFTATFELMVNPAEGVDEYAEWDEFQKVIDATVDGTLPKALDIYHPNLARVNIGSVSKALVGGIVDDPEDPGLGSVSVKFQEYVPPTAKGGGPTGSSAKKPDPKGAPDPNAEALAELARLTEEYRTTPWG